MIFATTLMWTLSDVHTKGQLSAGKVSSQTCLHRDKKQHCDYHL